MRLDTRTQLSSFGQTTDRVHEFSKKKSTIKSSKFKVIRRGLHNRVVRRIFKDLNQIPLILNF